MTPQNEDDYASTSCEEWPNREILRNSQFSPDILNAPIRYQKIIGDLFHSTDSLAHCVSADFQMSAGIAREIRRNFSTSYPNNLGNILSPLWPQWIPSQKRYIISLPNKSSTTRQLLEHCALPSNVCGHMRRRTDFVKSACPESVPDSTNSNGTWFDNLSKTHSKHHRLASLCTLKRNLGQRHRRRQPRLLIR